MKRDVGFVGYGLSAPHGVPELELIVRECMRVLRRARGWSCSRSVGTTSGKMLSRSLPLGPGKKNTVARPGPAADTAPGSSRYGRPARIVGCSETVRYHRLSPASARGSSRTASTPADRSNPLSSRRNIADLGAEDWHSSAPRVPPDCRRHRSRRLIQRFPSIGSPFRSPQVAGRLMSPPRWVSTDRLRGIPTPRFSSEPQPKLKRREDASWAQKTRPATRSTT